MRRAPHRVAWALGLLTTVHLATLSAGFLAPSDPNEQARDFASAPPTALRWIDRDGRVHLRPFVVGLTALDVPGPPRYEEDWNHLLPGGLVRERERRTRRALDTVRRERADAGHAVRRRRFRT